PARAPRASIAAPQAKTPEEPVDGQRVHSWAEHAQDRRQERQREADRGEHDDRAAEPDRAEGRRPEEEEPGQPDRDRDTGEQDGLAGRADRSLHRLLDAPAAGELFTEPARDEQ